MAKTTTTSRTPLDAFKAHVSSFAQRHPFRSGVKEVLDDLVQLTFWVHKVPLGCLMVHRADLIKAYHAADTRVVMIHPNVEHSHVHGFWEGGKLAHVEVEVPPLILVFAALLAREVKASVARCKA